MFENGLEEEVNALFKKYDPSLKSLQAIGYKEFTQVPREEVRELIKKNTRNYAKRQMTFFKNQFADILWFSSKAEALDYIKGLKHV
jgi:tRNA dimethylallyltransferase